MNIWILVAIAVFTFLLSTFIGYISPMMIREQKFLKNWNKCPECTRVKKQKEIYNIFNFWKYGGYCEKHKTKTWKNLMFSFVFTVISIFPFVFEFFTSSIVFSVTSVTFYIVSMMLVYLSYTDYKGMVIPDFCNIVIFLVGLFAMFYTAITSGDNGVYLNHIIGMFCISLPLFLLCWLGKGGFGDVKLLLGIGLFLGWQNTVLAMLIAIITGCIYSLIKWIVSKNVKWKTEMPFGPFICLGTYISMFFGETIIKAYLSLFI